jgi:hypothetical protein
MGRPEIPGKRDEAIVVGKKKGQIHYKLGFNMNKVRANKDSLGQPLGTILPKLREKNSPLDYFREWNTNGLKGIKYWSRDIRNEKN